MKITELLTMLTAIFVTSSALIFILNRFEHPSLPAYIMAGAVIGIFFDSSRIIELSQLGIAFLVFIFGLNTEPERIRSVARESAWTTLVQIAVIGVFSYIIARGLGLDILNSLYFVITASLSSSLVGLELIENEIRYDLIHGRLSESIHLLQDLVAVAAVLLISHSGPGIQPLVTGSAIIGSALVARSTVFPMLAERLDSSELTMMTGLATLTGFLAVSEFLGLSIVIGSFAAGLSVASFPYNLEMLETMGSLKDFFSAIFFVALGALVTVPSAASLVLVVILLVSTVILKPAFTVLALMTSGYDRRTSYLTALTLDQVSEFSLIIAIQAYIAGLILPELFNAIIVTAAITMITSAYTTEHQEKIYRFISRHSLVERTETKIEEWSKVPELEDHVILVGYDIQGKEIAEKLEEEDQDYIVIDNDPEKIIEARKNGENYVFGDVMDDLVWEKARSEEARLVVSTVPFRRVSNAVLERPEDFDMILRSRQVDEARDLLERGAMYVAVPDIVASEELIDHLRGVMEDRNYAEELRRKNLLELRNQLNETG